MRAEATSTDSFAQSFATQYISLILLILIVVVAAFLPKEKIERDIPPVVEFVAEPVAAEAIMSAQIPDLIQPGAVNVGALAPYRSLIDSHDVSIRITLFFQSPSEIRFAESIAERVRTALETSGFAPEALEVIVAHNDHPLPAQLELLKGASRWEL